MPDLQVGLPELRGVKDGIAIMLPDSRFEAIQIKLTPLVAFPNQFDNGCPNQGMRRGICPHLAGQIVAMR